mgnify:CR=1 FL=1
MPIRFKHGIEVDGSVTVDGQSLGSNAFNSTTIPTHTSNLTNDSGFITQAAGDLRYLRGVPSETGYNIQLLPCAIEIYDQTTGGDLSWVVGADDRGGVGQVGQNAFVIRYGRGSRFNSTWRSQGTEAMTIDDSGRVGFTAPAPNARFEIGDNGFTNNRLRIYNEGGSGSHDASIELVNADDGAGHVGGTWLARSYGWGNASLQLGGTTTGQWSGRYNISTTQKTYFENSGGVGIRVVPDTTLDVSGEITGRGGDTGLIFKSRNTSATGAPDQFKIEHNYGSVNISNPRGDINFTTALKQGGNTVATQTWVGNNYQPSGSYAAASHSHTFASLTEKPTTLSGYGITDAASSTHNHDDLYLKKGTGFNSNYVRAGYGYYNSVAQTYWWKVCTVVADGHYRDYNIHLDWTSRYANGEMLLHVHSDNDVILDVFDDYVMQKSQDYGKSIGDFVWVKPDESSLEIWVATPAWQEFDYMIRSNVNEGTPEITYYVQGQVEPLTKMPVGATQFNEHKWNQAYDNYITGISVTGTTTKTITLTQRDGGQISGTFTDIDNNTWRPIDDTPVDGATTESISSNWAYDHVNARNPHGTTASDVGAASSTHNHTSLTGVTSLVFSAQSTDAASITTTISGTSTFFDFNLTDDNNNDWWRWRFTPSGSTVYDAMTLKPVSNGNADLTVSGSVYADNLAISNWNTAYDWGNHANLYLPLSGGTVSGNIQVNGHIRGGGQQLVLNAGESHSYATGQTNELVYINAEGGLQVNTSPDNWSSGWAGRDTSYLTGTTLGIQGETLTKTNIQNFKTAYDWGNHAGAGYLTVTSQLRPEAPTTVTATVVGETIEIAFNESATAAVDYYQVWAAQDSGSFSLIGQIPYTDFADTMTVVDSVFTLKGTRNYRVYAVRKGMYSDAATASRAFTSPSLEPVNLSVVPMEEAFFVQWDAPNSRFVDHYEVYIHSAPEQGALDRGAASLAYSGTNTFYMYQATNNEFHQFWVDVIES